MSNWIHRFLNPHCPHCLPVCQSCETLTKQLDIVNYEKKQLMDKLLAPPVKEEPPKFTEMTRPVNVPWAVRRQMLEAEDREKAKLMRNAPIPTEDLEKELDVAKETRENQH